MGKSINSVLATSGDDSWRGSRLSDLKGGYLQSRSPHPVDDGYISQELWNKSASEFQQDASEEDKINFLRWQADYQAHLEKERLQWKDQDSLRKLIDEHISRESNFVSIINGNPFDRDIEKKTLVWQLMLLARLPTLSLPGDREAEEWLNHDLHILDPSTLYPLVTDSGSLNRVKDLVYKFCYGPNAFDWQRAKIPFKLDGQKVTLYFVKIDLGGIAGIESQYVYKVGITKKDVIGDKSSARFHGKHGKHIKVLRQISYSDGKDAFLREQKVIEYNARNKLSGKENPKTKEEACTYSKFVTNNLIPNQIWKFLGSSEWVFSRLSEAEALLLFDQLTNHDAYFENAANE